MVAHAFAAKSGLEEKGRIWVNARDRQPPAGAKVEVAYDPALERPDAVINWYSTTKGDKSIVKWRYAFNQELTKINKACVDQPKLTLVPPTVSPPEGPVHRNCLRCDQPFMSDGPENRMCAGCINIARHHRSGFDD